MRQSLRSQFFLSFGVLLGLLLAVVLVAMYASVRLERDVNVILERNYRSVVAASNLLVELERYRNAQLLELDGSSARTRAALVRSREQFVYWSALAHDYVGPTDTTGYLDAIAAEHAVYTARVDSLLGQVAAQRRSSSAPTDGRPFQAAVEQDHERLRELSQGFLGSRQYAINQTTRDVQAAARNARLLLFGFVVVAIWFGIGVSWWLAGRLTRPLNRLTLAVRGVASGQRREVPTAAGPVEMTLLVGEFNRMVAELGRYESLNVERLMGEKAKAEAIVSSIADAVLLSDAEHTVVMVNPAAAPLLRVAPEAALGRQLSDVLRHPPVADAIADATAGLRPVVHPEGVRLEADGDDRFYSLRAIPILDAHGALFGVATLAHDVTPFRELDRMKSDFLATVSHELRTPLTSIGMTIDLLREGMTGPLSELQTDLLGAAREDADRLTKLVRDLLELARMERGGRALRLAPVDLVELAARLARAMRVQFEEKGVTLDLEPARPGLPPVPADEQQLGWGITNLLANALRFTPTGGRVTVTVGCGQRDEVAEDPVAWLRVTDTGPGIPADGLAHLFDRFVQLKQHGFTPGSVGLGLAITREVVTAHGGTVTVESEPGHGAAFTLWLPTAAAVASIESAPL